MPVIVGRAKADGDARQAGHRLDRSGSAAAAETRGRTAGNAGAKSVMRTAPPLRSVRTVDTTAVLRRYSDWKSAMSSRTTSENPFSSSPDEQAAEDRVAIEARIAPPYQTRRGIDERSRAPVADHGKIEPVIDHEAASASVREICSSQRRTSGRPLEAGFDAGDVCARRKCRFRRSRA